MNLVIGTLFLLIIAISMLIGVHKMSSSSSK